MAYYPRQIEPVLKKAVSQFRVLALTGARQTGKSTLLKHLFGRSHRYVTFDDPRDTKLAKEDPRLFFEQYPGPLILDEIQYVPELLSFVKMQVDRHQKKGEFILTGSQRFTMMKNLTESLAGRVGLFELLPMSIGEGRKASQNYPYRALTGSYPELVSLPAPDPERWYASYLSTYIEKDVQPHYSLEKVSHFRDFIFLLAARNSQLLNYQSLANDLGVSIPAVTYWLSILEASQIIYLLRPYHRNLGSRIVKSPKVYFTDLGLVAYLTGQKGRESLMRGPQAGSNFESFVIQETLKHYLNQGRRPPLYYFRTNNGLEVDLIIEDKPGVICPCEIKLSKSPHAGMAHSIERLRKIVGKKISIKPGFVISWVNEPRLLNRQDKACDLNQFLSLLGKSIKQYDDLYRKLAGSKNIRGK